MNSKKCLYCKKHNYLTSMRCDGCGAGEFEKVDHWPPIFNHPLLGVTYMAHSYAYSTSSRYINSTIKKEM